MTNTIPTADCPSPVDLERLVRGRLTEARSAALAEHVGSCSQCQRQLDQIAGGGDDLAVRLREAEQAQPPSDSSYWKALAQADDEIRITTVAAEKNGSADFSLSLTDEVRIDFLKPADKPGRIGQLGIFEVVREVGRGGMGVVLHAYDPYLERDVAIKVIDPKFAHNEVARKRFCREARAAAAVAHDNLVAVHQVDEDEDSGLPYLVMQLVLGESLEQRLKRVGKLSSLEVARLGMQAAAGLAAAHAGGLIHRDIKPGNILLESPVDRVKLTDFGLARAAEDVKLTRTGFVAGSPLYMAPEQARGDEVDARADLFSLGSVLYEAATGTPPFDGKTPLAVLRRVADETPPPLSTVNPDVPDWLSDIVDKLLAKDPADRYQSAEEVANIFAAEMARAHVLSPLDVPAEVCPGAATRSGTARARTPVCWKKVAFRVLPWVGGALAGALPALLWLQPADPVERIVTVPSPTAAVTAPTLPSGPEPNALLPGDSGSVWAIAFIPNSDHVVVGHEDGTVRIWNYKDSTTVKTLDRLNGTVWTADVSADGTTLVTACDDSLVNFWDLKKNRSTGIAFPHPTSVKAAVFSPSGKQLASGDRNAKVRLWDMDGSGSVPPVTLEGHRGTVHSLAYSPDGKQLASAGSDGMVRIWSLQDVKDTTPPTLTLSEHKGAVYSVAFSPDGTKLASAGWDGTVRLWDVTNGGTQIRVFKQDGDAWSVSFGNGGRWLAFAAQDTVRVCEVATGKEIFAYRGTRAYHTVRFAPDGTTLAAGGRDGAIRLWVIGKKGE